MLSKKTKDDAAVYKLFDEHHQLLEKARIEFMDAYKKKQEFQMSINDFEMTCTLGEGSFGCVVLSKHKPTSKYYAVKVMNKSRIMKDKQLEHTYNEKNVLLAVNFPFLIRMDFCFKDNCNIFFALPFVAGGDMFSLLRRAKTLKEKEAKFYAAQVVMGVEYLHYMDLLYRDLKPENIVVETNGYIKLTDYGFCKMVKLRTYTLCGTPEYLAPEIILSKGYGKSIDWWSVGVFIYEMIAGFTPFYADDPMRIYEKISTGKYKFTVEFSSQARDLIKNILQLDLSKRYGVLKNGVLDIKGHEWFKSTEWGMILAQKAVAPFIPKVGSPGDASNFDKYHKLRIQDSIHEKFPNEFADF